MVICGIDNGTTGSISFIERTESGAVQYLISVPVPTIEVFDYTKDIKRIHRVDHEYLKRVLTAYGPIKRMHCFMERPMINPTRFKQSILAARAFESTLIALENVKLGFTVIDSRAWQKALLPHGAKGVELKKAAMQKAKELFPGAGADIDYYADSICIAYYGLMQHQPTKEHQ